MDYLLETELTRSGQEAALSYQKEINKKYSDFIATQLVEESLDYSWNDVLPKRVKFGSIEEANAYLDARHGYNRRNYNIMYDNTTSKIQKLLESSIVGRNNSGDYANLVLPVLSRVYPNTISDKIVCTHAMSGPVALVPRREGVYLSNKGRTSAGNLLVRDFDPLYASEKISGELIRTGDGTNLGGAGTAFSGRLKYNPIRPNDNTVAPLSPRRFAVELRDQSPAGVVAQTLRDNGVGGWIRTDTGATISNATINYDSGEINAILFPAAPANGNLIVAVYYQISDGGIGALKSARVGQDIQLDQIIAEAFQLQTEISVQAMQDVQALYGQDPFEQIRNDITKELALGTDRLVLQDLRDAGSSFITPFNATPVPGINARERVGDIAIAINTAAGGVFKRSGRARSNFAVVSVDMFSALSQFTSTPMNWPNASTLDPSGPFGQLNPRMAPMVHGQGGVMNLRDHVVYEDITQIATDGNILIGLSSQDYLNAGYVFAPYIPLYISPSSSATNAETATLRYFFMTRFGRKLLRPEFYAQIAVTGFGS